MLMRIVEHLKQLCLLWIIICATSSVSTFGVEERDICANPSGIIRYDADWDMEWRFERSNCNINKVAILVLYLLPGNLERTYTNNAESKICYSGLHYYHPGDTYAQRFCTEVSNDLQIFAAEKFPVKLSFDAYSDRSFVIYYTTIIKGIEYGYQPTTINLCWDPLPGVVSHERKWEDTWHFETKGCGSDDLALMFYMDPTNLIYEHYKDGRHCYPSLSYMQAGDRNFSTLCMRRINHLPVWAANKFPLRIKYSGSNSIDFKIYYKVINKSNYTEKDVNRTTYPATTPTRAKSAIIADQSNEDFYRTTYPTTTPTNVMTDIIADKSDEEAAVAYTSPPVLRKPTYTTLPNARRSENDVNRTTYPATTPTRAMSAIIADQSYEDFYRTTYPTTTPINVMAAIVDDQSDEGYQPTTINLCWDPLPGFVSHERKWEDTWHFETKGCGSDDLGLMFYLDSTNLRYEDYDDGRRCYPSLSYKQAGDRNFSTLCMRRINHLPVWAANKFPLRIKYSGSSSSDFKIYYKFINKSNYTEKDVNRTTYPATTPTRAMSAIFADQSYEDFYRTTYPTTTPTNMMAAIIADQSDEGNDWNFYASTPIIQNGNESPRIAQGAGLLSVDTILAITFGNLFAITFLILAILLCRMYCSKRVQNDTSNLILNASNVAYQSGSLVNVPVSGKNQNTGSDLTPNVCYIVYQTGDVENICSGCKSKKNETSSRVDIESNVAYVNGAFGNGEPSAV